MRHPHLFSRLRGAAIMAHPKLRIYANKNTNSVGGMISHVNSKFQQMTLNHGAGIKSRKPLKFMC